MAAKDLALKPMPDRRGSDPLQRACGWVRRFVDMEIEVEAMLDRGAEHDVEGGVQLVDHEADAAQDVAAMHLHGRDDAAHVGGIEREGDGEEGCALQLDPSLPALARLGEDRPGDADLLAEGIDVGADGRDAVMLRRPEREIHARRDIGCIPIRLAILADILERAGEGAVGIGAAGPDMAFVQMRVGLDEGREENASVEVDHLHGCRRLSSCSAEARDRAA